MSADLSTRYLGISLANPLVVSACTMTGKLDALSQVVEVVADIDRLRSMLDDRYEMETVATGGEAFSALLDRPFDCAVLDLRLPDMTGFELLEKLGFRLEGHLRENYWAEDRFVDSLIYAILRPEWKTRGGA